MAKLLVSPIYAGILALMLVMLGLYVSWTRNRTKIDLGDNNNMTMLQAIRVHGNFTEYVPLALIVIAVAEGAGNSKWIIHLLGGALVVARLLQAWGLHQSPGLTFGRGAGTGLTYLVLIAGGVLAILAGWSVTY